MFLERERPRGRAGRLIPASPKIYAHLPYVFELDDEVVRTRDNALMLSLEVTGIDGLTSGSSAIAALRTGFAHLLDTLDERFTFYMHRMMRPADTGLTPIHGTGFAADIDRAWGRELVRRNLQDAVTILTVVVSFMSGLAFRKRFFGDTVVFYLMIGSLVAPGLVLGIGVCVVVLVALLRSPRRDDTSTS